MVIRMTNVYVNLILYVGSLFRNLYSEHRRLSSTLGKC